ncbi:cytochrome P450 [Phycomyces nitens]|nr:cytochrome P450 [Phycomyces nitens]
MDQVWVQLLSNEKYILSTIGVVLLTIGAKVIYTLASPHAKTGIIIAGQPFKEIPSPKAGYPYVGHMFSMGSNPSIQVEKWHQELGPIIRIKMGIQSWVIINDPVIAHDVFVRNGTRTSGRPVHSFSTGLYSKGGRGVSFNQPGKRWRSTRAVASTVLAQKSVDKYTEMLEDIADRLVDTLISVSENDGPLVPFRYFQFASFSAIIKLALGISVKSIDDPLFLELLEMSDNVMVYSGITGDIGSFLPALKWITMFSKLQRNMVEMVEKRNKNITKLVNDAVEGDVECLAKQMDILRAEYGLVGQDINVLFSDLITAGGDTIAVTLYWLFGYLLQNPDVKNKMQDEIDSFIAENKRTPGFSDRNQLKYNVAVHRENLRFKPTTIFGLPHHITEDVVTHGYLIPKGTVALNGMHSMHMNPDVFTDPKTFNPDRYLGNEKTMLASNNGPIEERDTYAFGWGRRICPGIYMAETEIFNICTRILARCDIKPSLSKDGTPEYPDLDIMVAMGIVAIPEEYKLRFVPRKGPLEV